VIPTAIGMVIYLAIAATIGLLVWKYARWRPQPMDEAAAPTDREYRGVGCATVLIVALLVATAALLFLWLMVGGRH
jgi:hypothetical protein